MTEHRRNPPVQKALPLSDWPKADRDTWQAAQRGAGPLEDGGPASHLGAITVKDLTRRYSYFLDFLVNDERLEHDGPAAAYVTDDNIMDYVDFLKPRLSSVTLSQSIYKVARVAKCLAPDRDWTWLQRVVRRLDLRAEPRDKRSEVVEIKELHQLGLQLMERAESTQDMTIFARALLYRDGLIIALLATDPLRLDNITALDIGNTIIKDGTTWSIDLPEDKLKNHRPHLAILPDWIAPHIDRYVEHYRPVFPNSAHSSRLWFSWRGRPLDSGSLYQAVIKKTRAAFGKRINPHLFRDCLATSTAVHHGAQMGLAMTVLGHQSSAVIQKHYNQANMIDAVRAYQNIVLDEPPE